MSLSSCLVTIRMMARSYGFWRSGSCYPEWQQLFDTEEGQGRRRGQFLNRKRCLLAIDGRSALDELQESLVSVLANELVSEQ